MCIQRNRLIPFSIWVMGGGRTTPMDEGVNIRIQQNRKREKEKKRKIKTERESERESEKRYMRKKKENRNAIFSPTHNTNDR